MKRGRNIHDKSNMLEEKIPNNSNKIKRKRLPFVLPEDAVFDKIIDHICQDNQILFHVKWKTGKNSKETWEPISTLHRHNAEVYKYLKNYLSKHPDSKAISVVPIGFMKNCRTNFKIDHYCSMTIPPENLETQTLSSHSTNDSDGSNESNDLCNHGYQPPTIKDSSPIAQTETSQKKWTSKGSRHFSPIEIYSQPPNSTPVLSYHSFFICAFQDGSLIQPTDHLREIEKKIPIKVTTKIPLFTRSIQKETDQDLLCKLRRQKPEINNKELHVHFGSSFNNID